MNLRSFWRQRKIFDNLPIGFVSLAALKSALPLFRQGSRLEQVACYYRQTGVSTESGPA